MGTGPFPVLLILLELSSMGFSVEDVCGTTAHGINKTVKIVIGGENHCLFRLPNDENILIYRRQDCFNIDDIINEARQACAEYGARLLLFRSLDVIKRVHAMYTEITPQFNGTKVYYLLGAKVNRSAYFKESTPTKTQVVLFHWDSGENMTQAKLDHRLFQTKTWTLRDASADSIAYLSMPCLGSNTVSMPAIYSYSASQQIHPVYVLCHQIENTTMCTDENVKYRIATIAVLKGVMHCIFQLKDDTAAVTRCNITDLDHPGCFRVNVTSARALCAANSALLLQITNEEMFDAVVQASREMFERDLGTIFHPLGVSHQVAEATVNLEYVQHDIDFDNGMTMFNIRDLFSTPIHTRANRGALFYEPKDNTIEVVNPAHIDVPVAVVCHQDPQYPVNATSSFETTSSFEPIFTTTPSTVIASTLPRTPPTTPTMQPPAPATTTEHAMTSTKAQKVVAETTSGGASVIIHNYINFYTVTISASLATAVATFNNVNCGIQGLISG